MSNSNPKRILIVGAGEAGRTLAQALERQHGSQCLVVGFVDDHPEAANGSRDKVLGGRQDLLTLVDKHQVDEVIVADAPSWQERLVESLCSNGHRNLTVRVVPSMYEAMIGRPAFASVDDVPMLGLTVPTPPRAYVVAKRIFDVACSALALVVTSPVLALGALAIKLTSRGPVLYKQNRVGLNGVTFQMLKLRTMVADAERQTGPVLSCGKGDGRVTPVGRLLRKLRLDELPQFVNVLRGEMSVIGPRPERPCFVQDYEQKVPAYKQRHRIRPGITGLAQVNGYYQSSFDIKLRYDLMYIFNQSVMLDLKILLLTAKAIFCSGGS